MSGVLLIRGENVVALGEIVCPFTSLLFTLRIQACYALHRFRFI